MRAHADYSPMLHDAGPDNTAVRQGNRIKTGDIIALWQNTNKHFWERTLHNQAMTPADRESEGEGGLLQDCKPPAFYLPISQQRRRANLRAVMRISPKKV